MNSGNEEPVSLEAFEQTAQLDQLRRQNQRLKAELHKRGDELSAALGRLAVLEGIENLTPRPPKWTTPKRPASDAATIVAMLSDTHFDEQVRPEDVAGVNAYDREIGLRRLRTWADQVATLPDRGPAATIDGLVLMLGGDLSCGLIDALHLVGSDDTVLGTLLFWSEQIAAAVTMLADAYGNVHVPVVIGNHGRMTAKKRTHLAAADSTDYALARLVRRLLVEDQRITWQIDEASDAEFMVYDQRHVVSHGDQVTGGSGVGGILPPVQRWHYRKQQRQAGLGRPFDHLWLGHFHQVIFGPGWTVNGSLKGADGYSMAHNWPISPPEQVVAYVAPGDGVVWRTTIVAN